MGGGSGWERLVAMAVCMYGMRFFVSCFGL